MARCNCAGGGGPCLSPNPSNLARYDATGCLLVEAPAGVNGTVTLSSNLDLIPLAGTAFTPVGNLAVTLPTAGVYLVQADMTVNIHVEITAKTGQTVPSGTSYARSYGRLFNVTANATVPSSAVILGGVGADKFQRVQASNSGTCSAVVAVSAPTTIRAEANIDRQAGNNNLALVATSNVMATYSHMYYVRLS